MSTPDRLDMLALEAENARQRGLLMKALAGLTNMTTLAVFALTVLAFLAVL